MSPRSTAATATRSAPPSQQREAIEHWAAANGAEIVAWHEGLGRSGKTMHRGDVDAALERIRAGQTDGVIVAWLDRFSRAPVREALGVYEDITEAGGQGGRRGYGGAQPADPTGEMALTVQLAVSRMQWRKAADRYEQSRAEAIREGKAIGGAPFGYRFADPTPKDRGHGVRRLPSGSRPGAGADRPRAVRAQGWRGDVAGTGPLARRGRPEAERRALGAHDGDAA